MVVSNRRGVVDLSGQTLGKYQIENLQGAGGMGIVYRARDQVLGRTVAIKLMHEALADDPVMARRFLSEARHAAKCRHSNIVPIFDICQFDGCPAIISEFIDGQSAAEFIQAQRTRRAQSIDWQTALKITADVGRAIEFAHQRGIVHRDIKPANILLDRFNGEYVAKLTDFGLANAGGVESTRITSDGKIVGTPHYMSPEQCRGESLDARSDLYSLGATLHTLLTGRCPFPKDQAMQVLFAHCSQPVLPPSEINPDVPPACDAIVVRAMQKQPRDRFQDASRMLKAVLEAIETRSETGSQIKLPESRDVKTQTRRQSETRAQSETGTIEQSKLTKEHQTKPKPNQFASWWRSPGVLLGAAAAMAMLLTAGAMIRNAGFGNNPPGHKQPIEPNAFVDAPLRLARNWSQPPNVMELWGHAASMDVSAALNNQRYRQMIAWSVRNAAQTSTRVFVYGLSGPGDGKYVATSRIEREYAEIFGLRFVPNRNALLFCESQTLYWLDLNSNETTELLTCESTNLACLDVSPDGSMLAIGTSGWSGEDDIPGYVKIFDIDQPADDDHSRKAPAFTPRITARQIDLPELTSKNKNRSFSALAFAPNSGDSSSGSGRKRLAFASDDRMIHLLDIDNETVRSIECPAPPFGLDSVDTANFYGQSLSFSADGDMLASAGHVQAIVWNLDSDERKLVGPKQEFAISCVRFANHSNLLAFAGGSGIGLLDLEKASAPIAGKMLPGHNYNRVIDVRWFDDDTRITSLGEDFCIRFLDASESR